MKTSILVALAAGLTFSGDWTTSAPVSSSFYLTGCGVDTGKVLLNVGFPSEAFVLRSDAPLFAQASSISDLAVANGNPIQIYKGAETITFQYVNNESGCTSVTRTRILGISLDKK